MKNYTLTLSHEEIKLIRMALVNARIDCGDNESAALYMELREKIIDQCKAQ